MTQMIEPAAGLYVAGQKQKTIRSEARIENYQEDANFARAETQFAAEEANRRMTLADALESQADAMGSQIAGAASRGVSAFSGSPLAAMRETTRKSGMMVDRSKAESAEAKRQLSFERYGSKTAKDATTYRSRQKARAIRGRATMNFLDQGFDALKGMKVSKPKTK
jgi:hypothetical protein